MTTVAKLLAQKEQLIERLQKNPGPQECEEIERLLIKIDTALNLLEEPGPSKPEYKRCSGGHALDQRGF
jgi:hypothetical protein